MRLVTIVLEVQDEVENEQPMDEAVRFALETSMARVIDPQTERVVSIDVVDARS